MPARQAIMVIGRPRQRKWPAPRLEPFRRKMLPNDKEDDRLERAATVRLLVFACKCCFWKGQGKPIEKSTSLFGGAALAPAAQYSAPGSGRASGRLNGGGHLPRLSLISLSACSKCRLARLLRRQLSSGPLCVPVNCCRRCRFIQAPVAYWCAVWPPARSLARQEGLAKRRTQTASFKVD